MFNEFWRLYPYRNGKKIGKHQCKELFEKLSEIEQCDVITAVSNYAAGNDYPVDPIRFFKSKDYPKGLWREWVNPEVDSGLQAKSIGRNGRRDTTNAALDNARETVGIRKRSTTLPVKVYSSTEPTEDSRRMDRMEKGLDTKISGSTKMETYGVGEFRKAFYN